MYPGGSQQYPYGAGGGQYGPGQQPAYGAPPPQQPYYDPNAYPQQPQPYYDPSGYPQQPQPGYDPNAYPAHYPQPGYQPAPAPPQRSGPGPAVFIVAAVAIVAMLAVVGVAVYLVKNAADKGTPSANGNGGSSGSASPAGPGGNKNGDGPHPTADPKAGMSTGTGPVKVDIYVDYQCPPCSTFEQVSAETLNGYLSAKKITLTIHPVAFIDERSKNKYSTRAAAAVECAYEQGKLLEFHTYLLNHQPNEDTAGPTDQELATGGKALGLNDTFATCVTSGQRTGWVSQATEAATDGGVDSVPAAYVNSRSVPATRSGLDNAIASA